MFFLGKKSRQAADERDAAHAILRERSELLDSACGVGLWEAVLHEGDALHPRSVWTWSPEFRRLLGYETLSAFPNVVQSWSDRLFPEDVAPTFAAFADHLKDRTGRSRYDVAYRLKVADGSYRWFRATGGCRHAADGSTIRACGSLTDIHQQKTAEIAAAATEEADRLAFAALATALAALASGDLTRRLDAALPAKAQRLKDDFNATIAQLQETMTEVSGRTDAIRSGSSEITKAADDLARRTEQQAAGLAQTAAALNEITTTVKATSAGALHARQVVATASTDAGASGLIVKQAIEAMSGIKNPPVRSVRSSA